jgi:hypothetical protein
MRFSGLPKLPKFMIAKILKAAVQTLSGSKIVLFAPAHQKDLTAGLKHKRCQVNHAWQKIESPLPQVSSIAEIAEVPPLSPSYMHLNHGN